MSPIFYTDTFKNSLAVIRHTLDGPVIYSLIIDCQICTSILAFSCHTHRFALGFSHNSHSGVWHF